jgi:hypothetical protein
MIQARGKVLFGNDEVIYSGTATQDEATALGNALKSIRYLQDRGVTVRLDKGTGGTVISFVVTDGAWNKPEIVSVFEGIAKQVAPAVGGLPVQLRLLNTNRVVEESSTVG